MAIITLLGTSRRKEKEMANLKQVKYTLENLDAIDGDKSTEYVDKAIESLETAAEALNTISVRGRTNLDMLLGIMLGIDMILGNEEEE